MDHALDDAEIDLPKGKVSAIKTNVKFEEIRDHLINNTMDMKAIERNYSKPEWGAFSYDALVWYKRKYLKPLIEEIENNTNEEVKEAIRKLIYDKKDVLETLLVYAVEAIQSGSLRINTVNELVKVTDQLFRLAGEGEYNTIKMKAGWGDKLEKSPRTKGKVYTINDFNTEPPEDKDYR